MENFKSNIIGVLAPDAATMEKNLTARFLELPDVQAMIAAAANEPKA